MDTPNLTPPADNTSVPPMVANYKKIKRTVADSSGTPAKKPVPPVQALASDPTKPLSPSNPLMVQKADGSVGQWGNDLKLPPVPASLQKNKIPLSDKAQGRSNTFYTAGQQNQSPSPSTPKSTNR